MYKISTENIGNVKKYVWHYRKDNKEYGPFTYEDIIEKVRNGEIGPEDYVLKFGNKKFIKASEVQGLFDIINQSEDKQEEQVEVSEDQAAVSMEETCEEGNEVFENRAVDMPGKHKQETHVSKLAMIIAGAAGLCLAVWILTLLL